MIIFQEKGLCDALQLDYSPVVQKQVLSFKKNTTDQNKAGWNWAGICWQQNDT